MDALLLWIGRLLGLIGVLMCGWAVYSRATGSYFAGGFQVGTLLQAGISAIVVACFFLLVVLTMRSRR